MHAYEYTICHAYTGKFGHDAYRLLNFGGDFGIIYIKKLSVPKLVQNVN